MQLFCGYLGNRLLNFSDSCAKEWPVLRCPVSTAQDVAHISTDVLIDPKSPKAKTKVRLEQMLMVSNETATLS